MEAVCSSETLISTYQIAWCLKHEPTIWLLFVHLTVSHTGYRTAVYPPLFAVRGSENDTNRCMNTYFNDMIYTSFICGPCFFSAVWLLLTRWTILQFPSGASVVCSCAVTKELLTVIMMPRFRAQFFPVQLITHINFCTSVTLVFPGISFRSSQQFKDDSFKWSP